MIMVTPFVEMKLADIPGWNSIAKGIFDSHLEVTFVSSLQLCTFRKKSKSLGVGG